MSAETLRLLLVEDSAVEARIIEDTLRRACGAALEIAHVDRLATALERLSAGGFDAALTDLTLPDSDGFETFERLHNAFPELPIVVLTAHDDDQLALHAVAAGAQDYVVKGRIAPELLVQALRYAIERKRLEQGLRERAEELAVALRARNEFLAMVSHELRTPLDAILGWGALLQQGDLDAGQTREAVDGIMRNAQAQARLVEDLIDLAALVTGRLRLRRDEVRLDSVVRAAVRSVEVSARARDVSIDVDLDPDAGRVVGDPDRLQQVAWNLVCNAIKFTPNGGRVGVRVAAAGQDVELVVSDTGIGIAPDLLPRVFDSFWQANVDEGAPRPGLGLGLAIVRLLVELHGGTVRAESPGQGRGSTFRVTLPLRTRHADRASPPAEPPKA